MATKKKKVSATKTEPSADALANMYRGMGSSQPVTTPKSTPAVTPASTYVGGTKITPTTTFTNNSSVIPTSTPLETPISTYVGGTKVTPPVIETPRSTYVGGTKVTPTVIETPKVTTPFIPEVFLEEPLLPDMPSEEDMVAAEDAYTQARQDLNLPPVVPPVVPQDNSKRQSAYDFLLAQFKQYGLEALVEPLKGLIADPSISEGEFTLRLRNTDPYKKRFAANAARTQKGLRALDEAEYIALEDQYQNVMRNYGLPATYYTRGELGRQEGLEKFIAGDVSASELEDRIITAQDRVLKANPEVLTTLKSYYGDAISNGDILAYALNPDQALKDIQRKVTAAEIGGAALAQGKEFGIGAGRAEELAGYGVTKAAAQQGYETVAAAAPRGSQLAAIYREGPYGQADVETEVFGLAGSAQAKKKREKLSALEQASFSKSTGASSAALGRERAMGQGAF